jgi:hypothetical protein
MAQPITAPSSFVYLVENIPDWQKEVETLSERASVKKGEFKAEYARFVGQIKPRRKQPPMEHYSPPDGPLDSRDLPSPPDRTEIDPFEAGNRYLYAQSRRKRKPGPSFRSGASGPQKFRTKNQVVVYYDGFLQEHLDALVKQIGSGRNNLRKGKNALVADQGFQLPRPSRATAPDCDSIEDKRSTLASRSTSALLAGRNINLTVRPETTQHETTFLQVDKELESIQSLCEVAAHRFLRDGDCQMEMNTIKQKLGEVLGRATTTAEILKKLAEDQSSKISKVETDNDSENPLSVKLSLTYTSKLSPQSSRGINGTLDEMQARGGSFSASDNSFGSTQASIVADVIEVDDDSDQEDIMVDMTAFRLAKARTRV